MSNIPTQKLSKTGLFQTVKDGAAVLGIGVYLLQCDQDLFLTVSDTDPNTEINPSSVKIEAWAKHPIEIKAGQIAYVRPIANCELQITV